MKILCVNIDGATGALHRGPDAARGPRRKTKKGTPPPRLVVLSRGTKKIFAPGPITMMLRHCEDIFLIYSRFVYLHVFLSLHCVMVNNLLGYCSCVELSGPPWRRPLDTAIPVPLLADLVCGPELNVSIPSGSLAIHTLWSLVVSV